MKALRYFLGGFLALVALNAFAGGIYGLWGAAGIPAEWLAGSSFHDYFIPSFILLTLVGGSLLVASIAVLAGWRHQRLLTAAAGLILIGWIGAQLWIIGYVSFLQPVVAVAGVVILGLATQLRSTTSSLPIGEAAAHFLAQRRIAVTGVSRSPEPHGANVVYRRLRERGYHVFAINPNTSEVEGDRAYPNLHAIPGGVDAVVLATRHETSEATMRECVDLGIKHAWMHGAFGQGSVSPAATQYGRAHGVEVIDGGCPCMFGPTADPGHKVLRVCLTLTGKVPRHVAQGTTA